MRYLAAIESTHLGQRRYDTVSIGAATSHDALTASACSSFTEPSLRIRSTARNSLQRARVGGNFSRKVKKVVS